MISTLIQNLSRSNFKASSLRKSNVRFLLRSSTSCESQSVAPPRVVYHQFSTNSESQAVSESVSPLSFLKDNGFSDSQLEKAVQVWPRLPSVGLDKVIKPKLKIFQQFGLSSPDIAEIVANNPWILYQSASKRIIPSLSVLKGLLGVDDLPKYLKVSGWYFRTNLENCLVPNVELLQNCGVSMDQILWHLYYFPRLLMCNPELMKKLVDRVDAMGVRRDSNHFIVAVRVFSSMSDTTWELKQQTFRDLGFSDNDIAMTLGRFPGVFAFSIETLKFKYRTLQEVGFSDDEIATAFRKYPSVFTMSAKKMKKTVGAILATGKYSVSCIIGIPVSLTFSVEKRYKPRFQVLETLESKNLIQNWPFLSTLCTMTDKAFHKRYIVPFWDEIGDANMATNAAGVK